MWRIIIIFLIYVNDEFLWKFIEDNFLELYTSVILFSIIFH